MQDRVLLEQGTIWLYYNLKQMQKINLAMDECVMYITRQSDSRVKTSDSWWDVPGKKQKRKISFEREHVDRWWINPVTDGTMLQ